MTNSWKWGLSMNVILSQREWLKSPLAVRQHVSVSLQSGKCSYLPIYLIKHKLNINNVLCCIPLTYEWICSKIKLYCFLLYASFVHIVYAKLGQADAGDNEVKLIMNMPLSGFEPATHWSEVQHDTSGLRSPPNASVPNVQITIGISYGSEHDVVCSPCHTK